MQTAAVAPCDGSNELVDSLTSLRDMLVREDVEGARAYVQALTDRWPESEDVRHYARVLAPPQVSIRRGRQGLSRRQERAWLREHAREYPGHWLALLQDRLIVADPDLGVVLATVRQTPGAEHALLHFQPGAPD